jgi:hypothetical protein
MPVVVVVELIKVVVCVVELCLHPTDRIDTVSSVMAAAICIIRYNMVLRYMGVSDSLRLPIFYSRRKVNG